MLEPAWKPYRLCAGGPGAPGAPAARAQVVKVAVVAGAVVEAAAGAALALAAHGRALALLVDDPPPALAALKTLVAGGLGRAGARAYERARRVRRQKVQRVAARASAGQPLRCL